MIGELLIGLKQVMPAISFIIVIGLAFFWGILYSEMISADEEARIIYLATQGRGIYIPENDSYKVCDVQSDLQGDIDWECYVLPKDKYLERVNNYCEAKYTSSVLDSIFNKPAAKKEDNTWDDNFNISGVPPIPNAPFGGG